MEHMKTAEVWTHTHFLQRDPLYQEEKPYSLRYTPPEGFPRANIKLERHEIMVKDIRPDKDKLSFRKDGYCINDLRSRMKYGDWDEDSKVKEIYLREVADMLRKTLGACHVQIFEHTVRKRHEIFPISTGEPYKYNQPTSIAHIDTTAPWVLDMVRSLNPENAAEILKHQVQCVNVWKPLVGPVKDWPLAMCDPQTMNVDRDLEPCDLVYPDYVVENRQVYYSDAFKWFYLSNQQPNEAWVFLQSDTDPIGKPGMNPSLLTCYG
ncbi:hypothetical protein DIS24_g729 [Lasiodiplodia hormozganensis]|uniref:Aspirochlorine biosynthesis protein N n=1 Tax=Lasiodiplodia hormozganensis TaxID=869390 RepID=A0AA39Z594_9PEZI|nr:hypothetical protein DIS24_g729 [Lasiodiplodia hormozganensis]